MVIRKYLVAILLCFVFNLYGYDDSLFLILRQEYVEKISKRSFSCGQTTTKAFDAYFRLAKNSTALVLLKHAHIHKFFSLNQVFLQDFQPDDCLQKAQQLMLVILYSKIFREHILQTEQLLAEVSDSLNYWRTEKFYEKLPLLRKIPSYWYHSPTYKKQIKAHVKALETMEEDLCYILGISLYGRYELNKIQDDQDFLIRLQQSTLPMYQYFNAPMRDNIQPTELFEDAFWLYKNIYSRLRQCKKLLIEHKKSNHIMRHGFLYSCVALTAVGSFATYMAYQEQMPEYFKKVKDGLRGFVEYVKKAFVDLKEVAWDDKVQELAPVKFTRRLGKIDKQDPIDEFPPAFWGAEEFANRPLRKLNDLMEKGVRVLNEDGIEFVNEVVQYGCCWVNENVVKKANENAGKREQIVLRVVLAMPIVIGSYALYYAGSSFYNQYIKHESWYKPMQLITRDIDKVLNKLTSQEQRSFVDDGRLHVLLLKLKSYMYCLPNEELELIQEDVAELLAYHLSYQQKRGVLDRMYREYEFLK